jgi:hypothetical protein
MGELLPFPVGPQAYARVIEARAWAMLNRPDGFNGHSADDIRRWGHGKPMRNTVSVAVYCASVGVMKGRITKSNCRKIECGIRRRFRQN